MAKLTIQDLKKIKENAKKSTALREGGATVKITVHMGTCGIAAGAREVMDALLEEMAASERQDIRVVTAGCMGMWTKISLSLSRASATTWPARGVSGRIATVSGHGSRSTRLAALRE